MFSKKPQRASESEAQRISILADQIENLYSFMPTSFIAHLFLSSLVTVALWNSADRALLLTWFGVRVAYATVQPFIYRAFKRAAPRDQSALRWGFHMTWSAIPSGALWGLAAVVFIDPGEPLTVIVIMAVLMGLGLGASSVDAAFQPVYYTFNLPLQALLIAGLIMNQVPSTDPLPAVIITGDTAPDRLIEAESAGHPLLHKPVQPAKLKATLTHLVSSA